MLFRRNLCSAECPRHGGLQCTPPHVRTYGATASVFSQDLRSAQQHGKTGHIVSVPHQQKAKRQRARTHNLAGQHCGEASVTQHYSESKASRQCLPNAVVDLQASTSNGAEAAVPTEQGQSQGMGKSSSQLRSRDNLEELSASKGIQRPSTQLALWCWEWANTRWRASLFFLMASVAFVIGSGASLQPHIFAGNRMMGRLLMEVPFAVGSLSYLMGAHLYKKAAVEAYALHRRTKGSKAAVLKWAKVEVTGTAMIVLGCELGSLSSCTPLLLQLCPASVAQAPLTALEAWLGAALNTAAGALFVVGSYTILAGMYSSFAPQRALLGPRARTLNFWGSASYLLGSCGLLIGALFAQPLFAAPPAVTFWLGQVVGYFIGSWWFVTGALAQIADVAQQMQGNVLGTQLQNTAGTIHKASNS